MWPILIANVANENVRVSHSKKWFIWSRAETIKLYKTGVFVIAREFHPNLIFVFNVNGYNGEDLPYFIEYSAHFLHGKWCWNISCALYMASMMNKLAMINSCEIILEK